MKLRLIVMMTALLGGCAKNVPEKLPEAVVVQVEVKCQPETRVLDRVYTSEEKMMAVLEYLRSVDGRWLYNKSIPDHHYSQLIITTTNSQGVRREYRQYGTDYLLRPGDRLYVLYPDQGQKLRSILLENDSD